MAARTNVLVLAHTHLLEAIFPGPVRADLESFAHARYNNLGRDLTESELRARVPDLDACITTWGSPRFTPEVVAAAPRLKIIAHAAGTVKPFVSDAVFARNIVVTSAAPVIARYAGEMALLLSLSCLRNLPRIDRALKHDRAWHLEDLADAQTLREQRVGLIGFGATAREFAALLKPFRVELLCFDPHVDTTALASHGARAAELEEILTTCKVISLHAASVPSTRHLLNAARLGLISDGAVLINTARGALIDTAALVKELRTGRFSAALDVFDPDEPLPADHPLRDLPNVILTPHVAGPVASRYHEMGRQAVTNVRLVCSPRSGPAAATLSGAVTPEQLEWIA
ncbi:MAG: hydroxyacid dehydrogenase [Armatimonadota bacterium]|nr:MAG: hydroxyacid dehydrogenase [Armatimonadota bacterium]